MNTALKEIEFSTTDLNNLYKLLLEYSAACKPDQQLNYKSNYYAMTDKKKKIKDKICAYCANCDLGPLDELLKYNEGHGFSVRYDFYRFLLDFPYETCRQVDVIGIYPCEIEEIVQSVMNVRSSSNYKEVHVMGAFVNLERSPNDKTLIDKTKNEIENCLGFDPNTELTPSQKARTYTFLKDDVNVSDRLIEMAYGKNSKVLANLHSIK